MAGTNGWGGERGGRVVAAPLLYCYFMLSPSEKNADMVSPAVLSSQKMKHWKEMGVCREV